MLTEKTTDDCLVSILMTAYNREQFIGEAIDSVQASSYNNWELIITDDGSTDNTLQIARNFAKNDSRIRVFNNEKNLGDYPNRNHAASFARGEFIVIVDSDDRMFKGTLVKWVAIMQQFNASFGIFENTGYKEPVILTSERIVHQHFFNSPVLSFGPIATIIKREYFKSIEGFPVLYGPANDMYYNLKAASRTNTVIFPFPLVNYRIHAGQEINNKYSYLYNNYLYLRDALNELDLPLTLEEKKYLLHKNKRRFVVNIFRYLFKTGQARRTLAALRRAGFNWNDLTDAIINKPKPASQN